MRWRKLANLTYADFTDPGLSHAYDLADLTARSSIHGILLEPTTAFAGPELGSVLLRAGLVGETDLYIPDWQAMGAPSDTHFVPGWINDIETLAGWSIRITMTADIELSALTAGAFDVFVLEAIIPAAT